MKKTALSLIFTLFFALIILTACQGEPHEHTPEVLTPQNYIPSTCTKEGSYTEVVICYECFEELSRATKYVPKAAHTPGEPLTEAGKAATCEEAGYYFEVICCTKCDYEIARTEKPIAKLEHVPGTPTRIDGKAATCEEAGYYFEVICCTKCDYEIARTEKEIGVIPHSPATLAGVAATLTKDGLTDGEYCTECNDVLTEREVIPAEINGTTARVTGFNLSESIFTLTVASTVDNINLKEAVLINEAASAAITVGESELASGILTLTYGANTATLTVTREGFEATVYTISVYRTPVYTVSFVTGTDTAIPDDTVEEGAKVNKPSELNKKGYSFGGWYLDNNAFDFEAPITKSITLTAIWTPIEYTVTYYWNDKEITHTPTTFTVESDAIALTPYTADGYTFGGWYLDAALTEAVIEISKGSVGDLTLYLKLTENAPQNQYTITYHLAGGTNAEGNPEFYTVENAPKLLNPTKEGHTFAGWYTDPYFKNGIATLENKTGDLVLYAKWVQTGSSGILTPEDKFD